MLILKRALTLMIILAVAAGMYVIAIVFLPWQWVYSSEMHHAEQVAQQIETFIQRNQRLPNTNSITEMQSLGFILRVGYHPKPTFLADHEFELMVTRGFDGPCLYYHSTSKTWRREHCQ